MRIRRPNPGGDGVRPFCWTFLLGVAATLGCDSSATTAANPTGPTGEMTGAEITVAEITGNGIPGDTIVAMTAAPSGAGKTTDEKSADGDVATGGGWESFRNGPQLQGITDAALPEKLELLWTYDTGEVVSATAAIVDGRVYAASLSGELLCLDLKSGEKIWSYRSSTEEDPNSFLPGFKASPLVTSKLVLLGDEVGMFHAVDRETGTGVWQYKTTGEAEIISSATLVDDKVLFGSYDNHLYCLNLSDGAEAWRFMTDGYVHCTPAVAEGLTFVAGCDEHLRMIEIATGEEKAQLLLETYMIASPAVHGDHLYVGTYAGEVLAVNWKDKEITWRHRNGDKEFPYHSSAAVTDDYVIAGGRDKAVHAIDRKSGEGVWDFPTRGRVDSSPVVVGNRVFVGSSDGNLYELELSTGKETWKHLCGRALTASPAVAEGCLVIGGESPQGTIYCFGAKN